MIYRLSSPAGSDFSAQWRAHARAFCQPRLDLMRRMAACAALVINCGLQADALIEQGFEPTSERYSGVEARSEFWTLDLPIPIFPRSGDPFRAVAQVVTDTDE